MGHAGHFAGNRHASDIRLRYGDPFILVELLQPSVCNVGPGNCCLLGLVYVVYVGEDVGRALLTAVTSPGSSC
jgi:hypothetical protein